MATENQVAIPAPAPVTQRWVRVLLGGGVGVALGLAPLLGTIGVPGFVPLLATFPQVLQSTAIPLAAFALGVEGVMIQILAKDALRKASFRRALYRTLAVTCIAFVALVVLLSEAVVVVTYAGGAAQEAFAVGFGQRPESCASVCSPGASDVTCILELTGADLESCWGSTRIRRTNTILLFAYLGAMLGFGGLSGLAVLQGLGRKR